MDWFSVIAVAGWGVAMYALGSCLSLQRRVSELEDRSDLGFENDIHLLSLYQDIEKKVNALSDGE